MTIKKFDDFVNENNSINEGTIEDTVVAPKEEYQPKDELMGWARETFGEVRAEEDFDVIAMDAEYNVKEGKSRFRLEGEMDRKLVTYDFEVKDQGDSWRIDIMMSF